jgi:hypothetical protein
LIGGFEIVLILLVLGGLLLLQTRGRMGSVPLYVVIGVLLLVLFFALRFIRSLLGFLVLLAVVAGFLVWLRFRR